MTIPAKVLNGFMNMYPSFMTYEEEGLFAWYSKESVTGYTTGDTDFQILLMKYIVEEWKREVVLIYKGSNPYWIFHDICHSRKDVNNLIVCVDGKKEGLRLIEGVKLAKSHGLAWCVDAALLEQIKESYRDRWLLSFDIKECEKILRNGKKQTDNKQVSE
jgi:hypothetical protein